MKSQTLELLLGANWIRVIAVMRSLLAVLLIAGFAGTAVFGALAMGHESGGTHTGCLAAAAKAGSCPGASGAISLLFHFAAFRSFSTATFNGPAALAAFLSLFTALLLWSFSRFRHIGPESRFVLNQSFRWFETIVKVQRIRLIHWLARFERSPSPA